MRASRQATTLGAPAASASASNVPTGTTGSPAPKASPCATPQAIRRPVKDPGPAPKAMPCRCASSRFDVSNSASIIARISSECVCPASSSRQVSFPSCSSAAEQYSVEVSRARMFKEGPSALMKARNQRATQILAEPNRHKLVVIIAACEPPRVYDRQGRRAATAPSKNKIDPSGGPVMSRFLRSLGATSALFALALLGTPFASAQGPLRIGVITFLSGPAAGPFGVPAKNASDVLVDALNKGGQIPGYERKGFGGRPLEVVYVDEAGGPTKVVTEYRNLVARQDVDMVIGVISSGDCLAVAPVAEELKQFTVLFDCATNRIFEEASYKYVFRTTTMATQENVAAARYIAESFPNLKTFSGVNPNYAWGQDAW